MAVSFNHIPQNLRLPLYWAEIDPSRAGTFTNNRRILVFGHKITAGTMALDTPVRVGSADQAKALAGRGSVLHAMIKALRLNNGFDDVWMVAVTEPSGGQAAAGSIEVTAAATAAGTLSLYIAGQRLQLAITSGQTAAQIAAAINTAINAALDLPVTSTVDTATVTLTLRHKGVFGNGLDIRANYLGDLGAEVLPAGVAMTITETASGSGAPDVSDALAALGDEEFETIVHPWTDSATLNAFDTEWSDGDDGRWGWRRQLYGHIFTAHDATFGNLTTFGAARNGPHHTTWGYYNSPTPTWERAAAWAGQAHRALMNDPARPLHTLPLVGVKAAVKPDRFTAAEKNALLYDGISVAKELADNSLVIEQCITHYQTNAYGLDDNAMLKVQTLSTYAYVMRSQRFRITQRFPRHKLANDGTRFGAGQAIATPSIIKSEIYAHYVAMEELGLVENAQAAMANTIVERDATDPNRVNVLYTPDFVNQLDVLAVVGQYRLQFAAPPVTAGVPAI